MGGKADGIRVVLDALKADGFGFGDQCSQDSAASWQWSNDLSQLSGDSDVNELDESAVFS